MTDQGQDWAAPSERPDAGAPAPGAGQQPGYGSAGGPNGAWTPPPAPGLFPLHPLAFGRLLGTSFQVIRYNPTTTLVPAIAIAFIQIALVYGVSVQIGLTALDRIAQATDANRDAIIAGTIAEAAIGVLLTAAVSLVAQALLQGVVVLAVARGALGERIRLGAALRRAARSFWPLIGFAALLGVLEVVAVGVFVGLVVALAFAGRAGVIAAILVGVLGGLLLVVAFVWIGVRLALVPSVIVLERRGVFSSVGRAWSLIRGAFWRTFGLIAIILIIVQAAANIVSIPFSILGGALGGLLMPNAGSTDSSNIQATIGLALLTGAPAAIVAAIVAGIGSIAQVSCVALTYVDLRMRHEGLDLDLQRFVEAPGVAPDPFEPAGG